LRLPKQTTLDTGFGNSFTSGNLEVNALPPRLDPTLPGVTIITDWSIQCFVGRCRPPQRVSFSTHQRVKESGRQFAQHIGIGGGETRSANTCGQSIS
jgi:hypothetical protein